MSGALVMSVVGARPHFVKLFPLARAMAGRRTRHMILHTGQHYEANMSRLFFEELDIPAPDINLGVGSATHAEMTAQMLVGIERQLLEHTPAAVVVFGDTNSTLAATIAAAKLYIPVVHIEAGVRCDNRRMPEEINRKIIDHAADHLICPSALAVENLRKEGLTAGVMNPGDFMYDTFLYAKALAERRPSVLPTYGLTPGRYILSTVHREVSTASGASISRILDALAALDLPVILPMHPRTRDRVAKSGVALPPVDRLKVVEPLGYLELMQVLLGAAAVVTDSGGLQKEAYWAGVPCVTVMTETTWPETIDAGWNRLVGLDMDLMAAAVRDLHPTGARPDVYGAPGSAARMVEALGWA